MSRKAIIASGVITLLLASNAAFAVTVNSVHTNYRTGYTGGCGTGAACHTLYKGSFLPAQLSADPSTNYTAFCLSCHNSAGEAHEKTAGSPSSIAYNNLTGFRINTSYRGVSHSWTGRIGNAGTRIPVASGFRGTTCMPGQKVTCQTCHGSMGKTTGENVPLGSSSRPVVDTTTDSERIQYRLLGNFAPTSQYLNQYVKVYRDNGYWQSVEAPRKRKQFLVDPSEYVYNNLSGTVTFRTAQPSSAYIYVEIPEPYLRDGNSANQACLDCHNDRSGVMVNHPGDILKKSQHPVGIPVGHVNGTGETLRNITTIKLYLEEGKILCTSCHDPHNAKSNDGKLLREPEAALLCLDCHDSSKVSLHKGKKHPRYLNTTSIRATVCTDCHGPHNSGNLYLVREKVNTPSRGIREADFKSFTGAESFGADSGNSICEVCHTATDYHRADGSVKGHNPGKKCITCHLHKKGFSPSGGNAPCYACHAADKGSKDIKSLMGLGTSFVEGGKTSRHKILFDNLSGSSCLAMCHISGHNTSSPNLKVGDELSLCSGCHLSGPGTTSTGRGINVIANYAGSYHNYTATVPDEFGTFSYMGNCTKCHLPHGSDSYPNLRQSINGKSTGGNTEDLCFGCHDGMDGEAADIKTPWRGNPANFGHYDYAGNRQMACVTCHGPHGTQNDKMIQDSLGGPAQGQPRLARDGICRTCHSGNGGSVYNVMGNEPGSYGPDFNARSVHDFGLDVAMGGRTVDLTCVGCHDPHNTQNARLIREEIVFSGFTGGVRSVQVRVNANIQQGDGIKEYIGGWKDYCVACHTSMDITGGQSPYRRHPVGIPPGLFYPHTSGLGMKMLPMESGNISCVSCHYTHGSPKPSLLRFESGDTPENMMCLQCHDKDKFLQGGTGSHGGFMQNQGRCADCHDMHAKANRMLLTDATESVLCLKCHGGGNLSKYNVWRNLTTTADASALRGTGGTFGEYTELRGGNAHSLHSVNDEASPAPGGITTKHRCGTCHNPHGSKNYRVLRTVVNNVTGLYVTANTDADGNFINYSTGFVRFCSACHTDYSSTDDGNGNWIRHPVGIRLTDYPAEYYNFWTNTSYRPKVELEKGETVSCVSCHYAHGSAEPANLKFPGGRSVNACKTCHNRGTFDAGTPGSHAGFAGNDGTCSDCHSMHAEGNAKLLKADAETAICVSCHDKPGTSTNNNASHLDVWKGNVFDSPSSWFGTAGSFGAYDPVNGGNAPSMHPVNSDARIAPGDSATVVHCGTCHDGHGSTNYRLLKTTLNGKANIVVSANVDSNGHTLSYNGGMSGLCTACHKSYINCGSSAGYTRHPVDVALTAQEMANYNHAQGQKYLPLEAGNKVTCTTCHFAHGSPYPKMLRLPGNQTCQTCHAKGLDSANGYQDVLYTHGGFNGSNGNCSVCHSMHAANHRKLLLAAEETELCYGCHGPEGTMRSDYPAAQLVWAGDEPSSPDGWDGTGGSFGAFYNSTTGGTSKSHHDINKTDSQAPGGTTTEHRCGTCHNPHGNNNYRILRDDVNGRSGISVKAGAMGNYSSGMTVFCTACHSVYSQTGSGIDGYRRHPLGLVLTLQEQANLSNSAGSPKAQVESMKVMCLSCHFAHGSASYAMLRMPNYTSSESALCQQCHKKGYNASGTQYKNTHGGFNGNNANCGVCHSVHAKNNKKLLVESKESLLCDNCHSGIQKFMDFKSHDPDVKINAPSRFNVFSSIGNSFGNYSVGGGDVRSWHEIDGTHTAPGGKTLELRCGKCHNTHGGDNFAMLRETIENVTSIKVYGLLSSTGPNNTYISGFGKFCSACHTKLSRCGGNPWTRHPVEFRLTNKEYRNWSGSELTPKVPLEEGDMVTCITCHSSHGSKNHSLQRLGGNRMCQQCHKR